MALMIVVTGCGGSSAKDSGSPEAAEGGEAKEAVPKGAIRLSAQQIADAGIEVVRPIIGGEAGTIDLPATIEGDPQNVQVVAATIGGRLISLTRNLGQDVRRGDILGIIESREAASLNAEVEAARARSTLAQSNLRREQRLFTERVSPEQDLIAARTAATEADIALRLAQQQLGASGGGGGALNRLAIRSPISGQVIARNAILGQSVAADAELFRIANLSRVTITASLSPADAAQVKPGAGVQIIGPAGHQEGRVTFVSPVLDETTRLITVIASLDNRSGRWRVGEPVKASILVAAAGNVAISVPLAAVQTIDDKPMVFVRTAIGFRATPVVTGMTSGDRVTIASGLKGDEQIASVNSYTLKAELGKSATKDED
jgi:cobalt-zinc-cadmium efflux system membrane fusion protein